MASRKPDLDALTDEQLLDMRMCDLKLTIRNTPLEDRIRQLNEELAARGIRFTPHCWLSDDWYSPDGIPGDCDPVLPGPPSADAAGTKTVAGGRRGDAPVVHEDPAA